MWICETVFCGLRQKIFMAQVFLFDISVLYKYNTDMKLRSRLQTQRLRFLRQIQNLGPWIEGTLVTTSRKCGKDTAPATTKDPNIRSVS